MLTTTIKNLSNQTAYAQQLTSSLRVSLLFEKRAHANPLCLPVKGGGLGRAPFLVALPLSLSPSLPCPLSPSSHLLAPFDCVCPAQLAGLEGVDVSSAGVPSMAERKSLGQQAAENIRVFTAKMQARLSPVVDFVAV